MNIRAKLSITYLTVSLLALVFISVFIYFYVKQILTSEVLGHLESVSSIQSHRVRSIIEQNLERLRLVTSRTQLRISLSEYLKTGNPELLVKIRRIIGDALASIGSFTAISVLNKNGRVIVSTEPGQAKLNYRQYDFYAQARKENNAEHFFQDENGNLNVYLSGPLTINGEFVGILLIESNAHNIVSLIRDYSGLRQTGETLLGRISADGKAVQYLTPLRFNAEAALTLKEPIDNDANPLVKALAAKKALLTTATDYRGKEVLAATNYISETGWGVVVKIDTAEAFKPINSLVKYIFVITLGIMFVVIGVSYTFARMISKPIVQLTKTAHAINEGDLSQRAVVRGNDEAAELAGTFNNMANNLILTQYDLENMNKELQSHREHLEEKVSRRTRELEEKNKELESFAYTVSHDLRSPLRAIDGYSKILQEDYEAVLGDEGRINLARIRNAAQRMGDLIDDLLELSRINRSEITKKKIDLSSKVHSVLARLGHGVNGRKVDVVVQPGVYVTGDDLLMDIVVTNLVSNALKYTGKEQTARIEFGEVAKDGEQVYYFRDNGIGFDMKYSHKLFGAFQRLVAYDEYPGTGIGLATVYRVITRHGGRVWAEGEVGKGATFYFTVPSENS
ncbi:MAG: ATP-binding protein [Gammaproteobacteria bacterium]|jgi:signal transduction histidine kinase